MDGLQERDEDGLQEPDRIHGTPRIRDGLQESPRSEPASRTRTSPRSGAGARGEPERGSRRRAHGTEEPGSWSGGAGPILEEKFSLYIAFTFT